MAAGMGAGSGRWRGALAVALGLWAGLARAGHPAEPDEPRASGEEPVLAVFFTSEARGNLKPCG